MFVKEKYISPEIIARKVAVVLMDSGSDVESEGEDVGQGGGSGDQTIWEDAKDSGFNHGGFNDNTWD